MQVTGERTLPTVTQSSVHGVRASLLLLATLITSFIYSLYLFILDIYLSH